MDEMITIPEELGIIPIKGGVVFPEQPIPLIIHTPKLAKLIDEILTTNKLAGALTQRDPEIKEPAPEEVYPWLGFASGCLIFAIGYWLLASRALGLRHSHAHGHSHGEPSAEHTPAEHASPEHHGHSRGPEIDHHHGHDHDHDDGHAHEHGHDRSDHDAHSHAPDHGHGHSRVPEGEVTLWSLLTLGVSGGMVPCPSALVVLLAAVAMRRIVFGLILILSFSVGLAAVLILIGVLAVTATKFMTRSAAAAGWARALPVFSAGVVMLVGVTLAVSSLLSGGVLAAGR